MSCSLDIVDWIILILMILWLIIVIIDMFTDPILKDGSDI